MILLALPPVLLAVLLSVPDSDVVWEHHPSHFWLVLAASVGSGAIAFATGESALRRGDARLWLLSAAFLVAAGFLGLHSLATPRVLLDDPNAGFVYATPVGLVLAGALALASSAPLDGDRARRIMARAGVLRAAVFTLMAAWAAVSLGSLPPLDDPTPVESGALGLVIAAALGGLLYAGAAWRYLEHWRRRPTRLGLAVVIGLVLLAEALIATAAARNWHLTWWEWHVLLLAAVLIVAVTAHREADAERFAGLYLDETLVGEREVSVLFADLAGFTFWSEGRDPREVTEMLNAFFKVAVPPIVHHHDGQVDRLIGDAVMATWNTRADQPDHARLAAHAALALLEETRRLAAAHPDWPRFRVGLNSGPAAVGVLGSERERSYTVIGDTVNVAARLQGLAPVGKVAIGAGTLRALGEAASVRPLGQVEVKGKQQPVDAFVLEGLD